MTTEELQKILQSDEQLSLNEVKQIIYELKNDCVQYNEDQFKAGFYNGELNAFYICLDLLEKVDSVSIGIEKRILVLENDKKVRDTHDRVMSLFANMQYGKLCDSKERTEYYKLKLNEIFGAKAYTDTDGMTAKTITTDEPWLEDARRRGEDV